MILRFYFFLIEIVINKLFGIVFGGGIDRLMYGFEFLVFCYYNVYVVVEFVNLVLIGRIMREGYELKRK